MYLEAVAQIQEATPGSTIKVKIEAINRSSNSIELTSITSLPNNSTTTQNRDLKNNIVNNISLDLKLPESLNYTQPYWLKDNGTVGMYTVNDQENIGIPDIIRDVKVVFNLKINGVAIPYERTVIYKYNDDVKGEVYNYLDIVPQVTASIENKVLLFTDNKAKTVVVKIKSGKEDVKGNLQLELPKNWQVSPQSIPFTIAKKGTEQTVSFQVTPPLSADEAVLKSVAVIDNKRFDKEQIFINYDHITKQQVLQSAESKLIRTDLKTNNERIAYIMGAGDEVPNSLHQMGYTVLLEFGLTIPLTLWLLNKIFFLIL